LALPALLVTGLLKHTQKHFSLPGGFYGIESIFLLLALMALARIKSIEGLRYTAPGEWGKLLGLDRIPEVKTLTVQVHHSSTQSHDEAIKYLCDELNATETIFPGTNLKLIYKLGSS